MNKLVNKLKSEIEKLEKVVEELEKIDNEKCVVVGNYDEGGYSDGGFELIDFSIDVVIDMDDEYYKDGVVCIDVVMNKGDNG